MSKVLKHIKPGLNQKTRFEKIHTVIFENSKSASKLIAREIANLILSKQKKNEKCVLGLATGSSPISIYNELVTIHQNEKLSFKNVVTFNLNSSHVEISCGSRGILFSYKSHPTSLCLHICSSSEDSPSLTSIIEVGLIFNSSKSLTISFLASGFNRLSIT